MTLPRSIAAYFCCALLGWMSAVYGFYPAAPKSEHARPALAWMPHGALHTADSHNGHETGHRGAGQGQVPDSPTAACIATCIDLASDKIVPKAASGDLQPELIAVPVGYGQQVATLGAGRSDVLAYWPTGPPGRGLLSASGAARLVALNARLRI